MFRARHIRRPFYFTAGSAIAANEPIARPANVFELSGAGSFHHLFLRSLPASASAICYPARLSLLIKYASISKPEIDKDLGLRRSPLILDAVKFASGESFGPITI